MKKRQKIVINKKREVYTYVEMWNISENLLNKGIESNRDLVPQFMGSLVFTAFSLEAYLNHIGPQLFKCWPSLEHLGPKEKLNVIAERISVEIDYGKRPWQTVDGIFDFRNRIAHGKSEVVKTSKTTSRYRSSYEEFGKFDRTKWEKFCTQKNAKRAREDVEKIIKIFHEAGDFKPPYPFRRGFQESNGRLIDE